MALRYATPVLRELDDDIAHVQAVLDELLRKRKPLCKFINEQNTILAPIRRLPAEILIEIFMLCMDCDRSSFSPERSPLLVGQVCRGWRQVALSTQKLWSSITVTSYRPSSAKAKLWISRAGSTPLTIRLASGAPEFCNVEKMHPAIVVLVQHCDRWRHLDLRIHDLGVPCLSSIKHRLPWLESLQILNCTHNLDIFEVAPRLRSLILGPHIKLKAPWHQLTELDAHAHGITECLEILQLVPGLVRCTMRNSWRSSRTSILTHDIPILTFPRLHFFCILKFHPDEIFKHAQLPIIHTLHVAYQDDWRKARNSLKWLSREPFISSLRSLHTIRKLMIDHLDELEDSARIVHCLRALPSLEELCLRGPGCWVTADFLHLLTCQANIDVLVPGLEVLEITDRYIPCYESVRMIESRWGARKDGNGAGSHLKRLRFEISWIKEWLVDADILNRLRKFRQEGMDISVVEQGGYYQHDLLGATRGRYVVA